MVTLGELWSKVEKHDVDLYVGRGKQDPSVTTRLTELEKDMAQVKESSKERRWLEWSILIGVIGSLLQHWLLK